MYEQARCHGGVATHSCNVGLLRQTFLPQNFTIILLVDCLTLWHVFTMHNSIIIEEKKKASIIWNWCCSIVLFGSVRCRGLPLRRLDLSFGDIPRIHHQLWLFLKFSSFSTHSSRPGAAVTRACFVDPGFFFRYGNCDEEIQIRKNKALLYRKQTSWGDVICHMQVYAKVELCRFPFGCVSRSRIYALGPDTFWSHLVCVNPRGSECAKEVEYKKLQKTKTAARLQTTTLVSRIQQKKQT